MVRFTKRILPNGGNHEKYAAVFQQYRKAYPQLGGWMRETSSVS
jgi:sugar (pentulose or hexulose) kinase